MLDALTEIQRSRALWKLEIRARNREESLSVRAYRAAQRDAVKADQATLKYFEDREILESQMNRHARWSKRLEISPLHIDLVSDDQRRKRLYSRKEEIRKRAVSAMDHMNRGVNATVLEDSVVHSPLDMVELRKAKRHLLEQVRHLRAMKDVERTNMRMSMIL